MTLADVRFHWENVFLRLSNTSKIFTDIYKQRIWGDSPSVSGTGSNTEQTKVISKIIPKLLKKYKIGTLLDAPCGDYYWLRGVKLPIQKYIGLDIVDEIIRKNKKLYENQNRKFELGNIIVDKLLKSDLILCRDCLVHFSNADIKKTIENFQRSGAKYLLTTTFTKHSQNPNIPTGRWRPINLRARPFNFPKPLELFEEGCTEINGEFKDKSLALWRLDDIGEETLGFAKI